VDEKMTVIVSNYTKKSKNSLIKMQWQNNSSK